MDDLKIAQAIERDLQKEELKGLSDAIGKEGNQGDDMGSKQDAKTIVFAIIALVAVFALAFGGFNVYNSITAASVINVDDLHKENLAGDLNNEEGYLYNGFSFVYVDGLWWTEVNKGETLTKIPLHYGAREVEDILITGEISSNFGATPIHIAIDPTVNYNKYYTLALMEMNNNIVQGTKNTIVAACNQNDSVCEDYPVVDCNNPEGKSIIELLVSEETQIELKETCIRISGNGLDLVKAADRLLLQWYHIMN
ncbi:hypothetical protein COY27_06990 [Candidatus Woesearchaeota archaeon CG_4_10_14_0_2_um_filter_33_13]|nr:MAG: hypothetical protein COY27_06990 [Candidatus Woesearchaeota archaeon CG_4_10_14_0_2_um_filter_33_13]